MIQGQPAGWRSRPELWSVLRWGGNEKGRLAFPPLVVSFDESGHFVLSPPGADLCTGHVESGEYALGVSQLGIWNRLGGDVPGCALPPGGVASYGFSFSSNCATLTISVSMDSCTGGGLFGDGGTLKRKG